MPTAPAPHVVTDEPVGPDERIVPEGAVVPEAAVVPEDRQTVYGRERAEYGGIKFGVAFFGWLTATGLTAILGAIAAGVIAALGITSTGEKVSFGTALVGAIVLLVIVFVAYLAGGYVAGRMARFAGAKQGLAVWIWGLVVGGILAVTAAIAGPQFDILAKAGIVPAISFNGDQVLGTVFTVAGVIIVALLAAVLGGLAGMRFHRRVDRAGWSADRAVGDRPAQPEHKH